MKKRAAIILMAVLAGIQFFPLSMNHGNTTTASDFISIYGPSFSVTSLLHKSCYNCHSNNTEYPWYRYVQPLGWIMEHHISEGKESLNLSEFKEYSSRRKRSKLKSMVNQINDEEMPLPSYTIIHIESVLDDNEKHILISFLDSLRSIY